MIKQPMRISHRPLSLVAVGIILLLAVLTFVPSRYPYPTQPGRLNRWMLILTVPWVVLLLADLLRPGQA